MVVLLYDEKDLVPNDDGCTEFGCRVQFNISATTGTLKRVVWYFEEGGMVI